MPNILYIDGSKNLREYSIEFLKLREFNVVSAADGEEGIACIKEKEDLDLIICAADLPDMSGLDMLKEIRALDDERYQTLPFILTTFKVVPEMQEAATALGIHGFLVHKPFDAEKLRQEISKILDNK